MSQDPLDQIATVVETTSFLTWDLVVIGAVLAAFLAYAYTLGKEEVIHMMIAGYIAAFALSFPVHIAELASQVDVEQWVAKTAIMLIVFGVCFYVIKSNSFFEPYTVPTGYEIATFTVATVGLLTVVALTFIPDEIKLSFSTATLTLFTGSVATTIWSLVPAGTWIILRGDD